MAQVGHGDGWRNKSKTGEDDSYHTAQVGPRDRGREKSKKRIGFDLVLFGYNLDWDWSYPRNELAHPVMRTIFLVYIHIAICISGETHTKNMYAKMRGWNYGAKHVHAQSRFWEVKTDIWHPYYSFLLHARAALAWTKKKLLTLLVK